MTATVKKRISLLNLALPAVPPVQKDESFVEFSRLYNAVKLLASALDMMQPAVVATAGVDISFGRFVNLYWENDTLKARLANATTGMPAHAYCLTEDLKAGDSAEFLKMGLHPGFSGLVPATRYFLGTNGQVTTNPPALPQIQQAVGLAFSSSTMWVDCPTDYIGA